MQNTISLTRPVAGLNLRQWLCFDALTCLAMATLLLATVGPASALLGLPEALLRHAGLILIPCAGLMIVAARTGAKSLVWLVIVGNFAWSAASLLIALVLQPTGIGFALTLAQAAAVAVLGMLEWRARG